MRRGDIVLVALDPAVGNEQGKTRPAVVVSESRAGEAALVSGRGMITVVPLSSNTAIVRSFQALLRAERTGLPRDSKALAEQIRAVSVTRVVRAIGFADHETMAAVDEALRVHLAL